MQEIDEMITLLRKTFQISDKGTLNEYLGIKIHCKGDGTFHLMQPQLIDSILDDLHLTETCKKLDLPYLVTKILHQDSEGASFDGHFNYCSVFGKLLYLEKSMRPELAYAVHQCAQFCADLMKSHGEVIKKIGRYLLTTQDQGMILTPTKESFKCWVDASHAGEWNHADAMLDATMTKSRMGYMITYAGCPILWASKLQTKITLSSTESEYITLSRALCKVIPLTSLIKEVQKHGIDVHTN